MQEAPKLLDLNGLEQYNNHIQGQVGRLWEEVNYLSDNVQSRMQYDELPEASEEYEGRIFQYIGYTDIYTKGYFYECVADYSQGDPVYSWQWVDVAGIGTALNQSY